MSYPRQFSLLSVDELLKAAGDYQLVLNGSGATPTVDAALLKRAVRLMMPGMMDKEYEAYDAEIDAHLATVAFQRDAAQQTADLGGTAPGFHPKPPPGFKEAPPPPDANPNEMTQPMKEANKETA